MQEKDCINRLLRFKAISEDVFQYYNTGLPLTQIYRKFIWPKYFVSLRTVHYALAYHVDNELKNLGYTQERVNAVLQKHIEVCKNTSRTDTAVDLARLPGNTKDLHSGTDI
jgi:hypothetical protein